MTSNRREGQGRPPRGGHAERSPYQRHDRRNTNRQRGRGCAMSVLENAKSKGHQKTPQVEPGGAGRKFKHLTRGDLCRESGREVSRGRSSAEGQRKQAGAKGRRTSERTPAFGLRGAGEKASETRRARQLRQLPAGAGANGAAGGRSPGAKAGVIVWVSRAKGGGRRCSMK